LGTISALDSRNAAVPYPRTLYPREFRIRA
jgi:hypothetical protein